MRDTNGWKIVLDWSSESREKIRTSSEGEVHLVAAIPRKWNYPFRSFVTRSIAQQYFRSVVVDQEFASYEGSLPMKLEV